MKRKLIVAALLLLLVAVALPLRRTAAAPVPAAEKVSPFVLSAFEASQQTQFFVVLTEEADLSGARGLTTKSEKGTFVYNTLYDLAQTSQAPLRALLDTRSITYQSFYIVNALLVTGDSALMNELAARPDVARIEANPTIQNVIPTPDQLSETPSQVLAVEPGVTYIKAPDVWNLGFTGQGVVVGGQDTGYQWDHPALKNQYRGWNGTTTDHNYNWHDSIHSGGGSCGANSTQPCDDHMHGTHTMGTVVGTDGGANQIGVAPGARWIGCRNMDQGAGTPATYLECFEFFLAPYPVGGTPAQGDPTKSPDVTNNSWGCPPSEGCSADTLRAAVEAQVAAGIMTVVSAGNDGPSCSTVQDPPAIYDAAYSVGALQTGTDNIASFSSRGPVTIDGSNRIKPDIAAPGTSTRSSVPGNGYGTASGTSMAGPHVAGAAALLMSARPDLIGNQAAIEPYLNNNAVHISSTLCGSTAGVYPNNVFGFGRLNILAAVQAALGSGPTPTPTATATIAVPTVTATLPPTSIELGGIATENSSAPSLYLLVGLGVLVMAGVVIAKRR